MEHFLPFIRNIKISGRYHLTNLPSLAPKFYHFKQIHLEGMTIYKSEIDHLKKLFSKVENLRFTKCTFKFDIHKVIESCGNLVHLEFLFCHFFCIDQAYCWGRRYPALERFSNIYTCNNKLDLFLELNPNIQKFATDMSDLHIIKKSNIKFDELAVDIFLTANWGPITSKINDLNELYDRGLYKRLKLSFDFLPNQETIDSATTIRGLVKLCIGLLCYPVSLSNFVNLEELCIRQARQINNLEMLAKNFKNLKRIYFTRANIDHIMMFVTRTATLKAMKVEILTGLCNFWEKPKTNVIDLLALNRAREQLEGAEKVTILVDNEVYMATKWAMKETDLRLIRLKRCTSIEWDVDFDHRRENSFKNF